MKLMCGAVIVSMILIGCNSGDVIRTGGGGLNVNADFDCVFDFKPAPGQFINDPAAGYSGESTAVEAALYAERRLKSNMYLSLGGFGGYVVVGFDHDIVNTGGYNLAIGGNPTESSNEPGIVWVMSDDNGNGLPDDVWYELAGSNSGHDFILFETVRNYEVTYYRPASVGESVIWRDNMGNEGVIEYMQTSHRQDYYYPEWIAESSYTLSGTCLKASNYDRDGDGLYWINPAYDWGYVDNLGSDSVSGDVVDINASTQRYTLLKISNAIDSNGDAVHLDKIRFVKIQTGVNTTSGWLGEASTEVLSIKDYNMVLSGK